MSLRSVLSIKSILSLGSILSLRSSLSSDLGLNSFESCFPKFSQIEPKYNETLPSITARGPKNYILLYRLPVTRNLTNA